MHKEKRSHNSSPAEFTKQLLIPSLASALLYILIGGLLLMLWNAQALWRQFNTTVLQSTDPSSFSSSQATWLEKTFNSLWNGRIAQVLFWAFAGCAVYVCIWFVINVFSNVRNDFVADEYVHPSNYNRAGYWHSVIAKKVFLVAVLILSATFILTAIKLVSLLAKLFYSATQNFQLSPDLSEIISAILGTAFLVYVFVVLVRISFSAWRSVYADL